MTQILNVKNFTSQKGFVLVYLISETQVWIYQQNESYIFGGYPTFSPRKSALSNTSATVLDPFTKRVLHNLGYPTFSSSYFWSHQHESYILWYLFPPRKSALSNTSATVLNLSTERVLHFWTTFSYSYFWSQQHESYIFVISFAWLDSYFWSQQQVSYLWFKFFETNPISKIKKTFFFILIILIATFLSKLFLPHISGLSSTSAVLVFTNPTAIFNILVCVLVFLSVHRRIMIICTTWSQTDKKIIIK